MADDLNSIVAGCRRGDPRARKDIYERYHQSVFRLAARMVGVQDAADVTQDVFLKAYGGIAGFRGDAQFSTWLYRVTINECLRHRRKRRAAPGGRAHPGEGMATEGQL